MTYLKQWCLENNAINIINEWTGIDINNKEVDIDSITHGSSKKMLWKCRNGHTWYTTIVHRTINGSNCPYCNSFGTSFPEQFLYLALKEVFPDAENRVVVLKNKYNRGIEFDIGIPSIPLCIEYSPTSWHSDKKDRDILKREICHKYNVKFLAIIDDSYRELNEKISEEEIVIRLSTNRNKQIEQLKEIVRHIVNKYNNNNNFLIEYDKVINNADKISAGEILLEESLYFLYKELADEAQNIDTKLIKPGSNKIITWKCKNCNSSFEAMVYDRAIKKHGCKYCGYNWFTGRVIKAASQVVMCGVNDIASQVPELAKEFNTEYNNIKTNELRVNSHKKIYWKCINCGYGSEGEWIAQPSNRHFKKQGCPKCGYNWYKAQNGEEQKIINRKYLTDVEYKKLLDEYSPKNKYNPKDLAINSNKDVHWICRKCGYGLNNEWYVTVQQRAVLKSGCPKCRNNWSK